MKQKIANYGLFSAVALSLLTGCGGSSSGTPQNEQIVKENGIIAETQTQNGGGIKSLHKVKVCQLYLDNQQAMETII